MALINCPDCNKEISSNAPVCLGCGAPIGNAQESAGSGVSQLQTIQETSKKFKAQIVFASLMFWIGFIWMVGAMNSPYSDPQTPAYVMLAGMLWYIVVKIQVWWHHK